MTFGLPKRSTTRAYESPLVVASKARSYRETMYEQAATPTTDIANSDSAMSFVGFFMTPNVVGKGRCATLYRAASSDRRERP